MLDRAPLPEDVRLLGPGTPPRYAFSICTLMTRPDQYAQMVQSYRAAGFGADCEYLCIDNSRGNVYDAFAGSNAFLVEAQGRYVILTHQDVLLTFDDRAVLEERLAQLDRVDPSWSACGNAGGVAPGQLAIRISDPHGEDVAIGPFPRRVLSLDENFIIARRDANLSLSRDLSGYHLYGPDLCMMADIQGGSCYVINFHLRHLSGGTLDDGFRRAEVALAGKYARAFRSRWIQTTCTALFLSGSRAMRAIATSRVARRFTRRI